MTSLDPNTPLGAFGLVRIQSLRAFRQARIEVLNCCCDAWKMSQRAVSMEGIIPAALIGIMGRPGRFRKCRSAFKHLSRNPMTTIGCTLESQGLPMEHPKDLQDELKSILNIQAA